MTAQGPVGLRIGLALSGGGSRAVAFHLGCLRALHDMGVLGRVEVLSTVSGGSVIGAMYAAHDGPFEEFEVAVRRFLSRGLVRPALRAAVLTSEGIKALGFWTVVGTGSLAVGAVNVASRMVSKAIPASPARASLSRGWTLPLRRTASRTTILRRTLDDEVFGGRKIGSLRGRKPFLVVNAADLRTGSSFYFTPEDSGSWRLGKLEGADIPLAHAVTASAAHPLFLPALDECLTFLRSDGSRSVERVTLADGGIYDNLGLSPLWPDRDPSISLNVRRVDAIICCRAGYGLRQDPPTQFMFARLRSTVACIQERAQNGALARLFDLRRSGRLEALVVPYLGQDDAKLAFQPADPVTLAEVAGYPTDFSAMPAEWIERLTERGQQITRALVQEHAPGLAEASR